MRYVAMVAALAMSSAGAPGLAQRHVATKPRATTPTGPYNLTAANKHDIVVQLKDKLLDGESARWRWPKHVEKFGLYCGFVNAKNRMGAYTGFKPFMVVGGVGDGPKATGKFMVFSSSVASGTDDDTDGAVIQKMCTDSGYDLTTIPPES